jgi:hypothetical protein
MVLAKPLMRVCKFVLGDYSGLEPLFAAKRPHLKDHKNAKICMG